MFMNIVKRESACRHVTRDNHYFHAIAMHRSRNNVEHKLCMFKQFFSFIYSNDLRKNNQLGGEIAKWTNKRYLFPHWQ
jgi:hypothetical protein